MTTNAEISELPCLQVEKVATEPKEYLQNFLALKATPFHYSNANMATQVLDNKWGKKYEEYIAVPVTNKLVI